MVEALALMEARVDVLQRFYPNLPEAVLIARSNMAGCLQGFGRYDEALSTQRVIYEGYVKLFGQDDQETIRVGGNCVALLP